MKELDGRIKKEAKDRTRREVQRIIAAARQATKKQSAEILAQSRKEAEQIISEVTEIPKAQAQKESSVIIADATEMVKKINDDSVARVSEINGLLTEVTQNAERIFNQFKTELQAELAGLPPIIAKIKDNLEHRSTVDEITEAGATEADSEVGENRPFEGQGELKIMLPCDSM